MGFRKIHEEHSTSGMYHTVVRRNIDLDEYAVKLYGIIGEIPNTAYYTSDKEDALQTATAMLRDAETKFFNRTNVSGSIH